MPCIKCENGKYKFGETGRCQYNSFKSVTKLMKVTTMRKLIMIIHNLVSNNAKRT